MAITEFCAHGNIATSAKKERLAYKDIVELIKQVSEGLEYLHNEGMIHGNLKPSNILVRARRPLSVAIGDIGTPGNNEWLKQPHYLAPEIIPDPDQEQVQSAQPADVWALGAIALELLEGGMPDMLRPHNYPYRIHNHVAEKWPRGSKKVLGVLIRNMLKINPKKRLIAAECREEAEALLQSLAAAPPDQDRALVGRESEDSGDDKNGAGRVREVGKGNEAGGGKESGDGNRGKEASGGNRAGKGKKVDHSSEVSIASTDNATGSSGGDGHGSSEAGATRRNKRKQGTAPNESRAPDPKRRLRGASQD